jgi:2-polyprenyl-6-methoxyphenol hydroxylase-like FAD-dependent oxidoreductase
MHAQRWDHAVVLGAGIAGLVAARALADRFARVSVLERDALDERDAHRKGVPQAHHAHALLARGARFLAASFPGFRDDVLAAGGRVSDAGTGVRWLTPDGERLPAPIGAETFGLSRPALEQLLRARLRRIENVSLHAGSEIRAPRYDARARRFTGVLARSEGGGDSAIEADLVVDARGRGSRVVEWLRACGEEAPPEQRIAIDLAYVTRLFRAPAQARGLVATVRGTRLGALFLLEGDRLMATLGGYRGDAAPSPLPGFLDYARTLCTPLFAEALAGLAPLGEARAFRTPASIRRRFERVRSPAAGLIAIGDAACAFNPAFGQGMSSAALQAECLAETLRDERAAASARDFTRAFYARAARAAEAPWRLAAGEDFRVPGVTGDRPPAFALTRRFSTRLRLAATRDAAVAAQFVRVGHLLAPMSSLFAPSLLARIWRASRRSA